ncbi:MAG: hypothetical protein ACRCZF_24610, partial [Gemmataceae bacterium]
TGKQIWMLWNPDPKKEKDVKFSTPEFKTNGLMADTSGHAASAGPDGQGYFVLYADGGNTVCSRDPRDVEAPLSATVFEGVHQKTPGYGFKGASQTSVVFRLDTVTGTLEKGTWLSAWMEKARANALRINSVVADRAGRQILVGNSAFGCPTKDPWYVCRDGGYQGGGFIAVFDPNFQMIQAGYFPTSNFGSIAEREGTIVAVGSAKHWEDEPSQTTARTFQPAQKSYGGGNTDGYIVVLRTLK